MFCTPQRLVLHRRGAPLLDRLATELEMSSTELRLSLARSQIGDLILRVGARGGARVPVTTRGALVVVVIVMFRNPVLWVARTLVWCSDLATEFEAGVGGSLSLGSFEPLSDPLHQVTAGSVRNMRPWSRKLARSLRL